MRYVILNKKNEAVTSYSKELDNVHNEGGYAWKCAKTTAKHEKGHIIELVKDDKGVEQETGRWSFLPKKKKK